MSISTGKPALAVLHKTLNPFVMFDKIADSAYVIRVKYLSKNAGTNAAGTSDVTSFTARTEIPRLYEEHHELMLLLMGRMIAGELYPLTNKDGRPRFPGMQRAYEYFTMEYERELQKAKEKADRRYISRVPPASNWGGLEISYLSGHPYNR